MLRQPSWKLSIETSSTPEDIIHANPAAELRVREFLRQIRLSINIGSLDIRVNQHLPFHSGLGGGTQLALALAAAVELLKNRRLGEDPYQRARMVGRAERSAIGTMGFVKGGFLVDRGEVASNSTNRQVDHYSFPEAWRMVLVSPIDSEGLSGEREKVFFGQHPNMPEILITQLENQIVTNIVPSIQNARFSKFAESLELYGTSVGRFYAAEQGGVFSHPAMIELASRLRADGVIGMAQSSWGPCIAVPAESNNHAIQIAQQIPESIAGYRLNTSIAEAMNNGASIRTRHDESSSSSFL